jgi:hypothetical protein
MLGAFIVLQPEYLNAKTPRRQEPRQETKAQRRKELALSEAEGTQRTRKD